MKASWPKVLNMVLKFNPEIDQEALRSVFEVARESDKNFVNSVRFLEYLLPLNADDETLMAFFLSGMFLNGAISDTDVKKHANHEALKLLISIRKLKRLDYSKNDKSSQLEVLRRMFVTMAKDLRVVFIVLVRRLIELESLPKGKDAAEERELFARETLDVYAPIAARLGIYKLKIMLEDMAFRYTSPKDYQRISDELKALGKTLNAAIGVIERALHELLDQYGIEAEIFGRLKSVYSIYRKLKKKGYDSVEELYDIFAIRVILPSSLDEKGGQEPLDNLYRVLGLIHSEWKPISKRFKDYVAVPKPNGYRSLHTVVLGLGPEQLDQPVEIQIRSSEMHKDAEYGISSHWVYKSKASHGQVKQQQIEWLSKLMDLHRDIAQGRINELDFDVFSDRIFVLTPRGEIRDLPVGSTPIDFAYSIHTDIGHQCVVAKVDGMIVPFDHELKNGDVVQIITKKANVPKLQWLSFVKTTMARNKIKSFFSSLNRENNIKNGKTLLNAQLERIGKPKMDSNYAILKGLGKRSLNVAQREKIVEDVGKGVRFANEVVRKVYPYEKVLSEGPIFERALAQPAPDKEDVKDEVLVGGEEGMPVKLAACCKPKRKDYIVGYVTRGNRVTIHKASCALLDLLDRDRVIYASWKSSFTEDQVRPVRLKVTVVARVGLMRDLTEVISSFGVGILDLNIKRRKSGLFDDFFVLDIPDIDKFDQLVDKLENVKGVVKVSNGV